MGSDRGVGGIVQKFMAKLAAGPLLAGASSYIFNSESMMAAVRLLRYASRSSSLGTDDTKSAMPVAVSRLRTTLRKVASLMPM